jgi:hypothetical protein
MMEIVTNFPFLDTPFNFLKVQFQFTGYFSKISLVSLMIFGTAANFRSRQSNDFSEDILNFG